MTTGFGLRHFDGFATLSTYVVGRARCAPVSGPRILATVGLRRFGETCGPAQRRGRETRAERVAAGRGQKAFSLSLKWCLRFHFLVVSRASSRQMKKCSVCFLKWSTVAASRRWSRQMRLSL